VEAPHHYNGLGTWLSSLLHSWRGLQTPLVHCILTVPLLCRFCAIEVQLPQGHIL
jgi:hypothetical protein